MDDPLKCFHKKLDAEALSPNQVFFRGCEKLPDHSHRLLTEAAIGSDGGKKRSIPTGLQNNRDKSWGGCSRHGCYWSVQVSLEMFQNADSFASTWRTPGVSLSRMLIVNEYPADAEGKKSYKAPDVNLHKLIVTFASKYAFITSR